MRKLALNDTIVQGRLRYKLDKLYRPYIDKDNKIAYEESTGWVVSRVDSVTKTFAMPSTLMGYPVLSIEGLFEDYSHADIDVRNMDVSNVMCMNSVFAYTNLKRLDLSTWNTPNLKIASEAFLVNDWEELNLGNLDFTHITAAVNLFGNNNQKLKGITLPKMRVNNKISLNDWFYSTVNLDYLDMRNVMIEENCEYTKICTWIDLSGIRVKLIITGNNATAQRVGEIIGIEKIDIPKSSFTKEYRQRMLEKMQLLGSSRPTLVNLV